MKFFKSLLAATLGSIIAFLIIVFLSFIIIAAIVAGSTSSPEPIVSENTVLKIDISGSLPARNIKNPFEEIFAPQPNTASLKSLKNNLAKAAADDNIQGILLKISFLNESWANLQEAHKIIAAFKDSSNKFVYAMTDDIGYNEKAYYLATSADSIFSPPNTFFEFDGFYTQVTFYDELLNKLDIEPEIAKHGRFKSAVEPFYRKSLSEPSELQLTKLIENVTNTFLGAVEQKSNVSVAKLNKLLQTQPQMGAEFGYKNGLIDSLLYPNQLQTLVENRLGINGADETYHTISNNDYARVSDKSAGLENVSSDHKIAVIYASGIILPQTVDSPFAQQEIISATDFAKQLEKVKKSKVDAIVIRINSPGGSGSTSDLIWKMIRETSDEIPVVVSMGGVAASGGYYIASAADAIVAQPTTITGSIGVFSTKFNAKKLFNEKLGINFDEVKSHPHADWLSSTRPFTPSEKKAFQQFVDSFYQTFISKVATSRNMSVNAVDKVGGGRVWNGKDALEQGLVDELGGLDDALAIAAEKANIENYEIIDYPKSKTLLELFMKSAQAKAKTFIGETFLGKKYMKNALKPLLLMKQQNMLLWYPYEIEIQ